MSRKTQLEIGAQQRAAHKVNEKQAEFNGQLRTLLGEVTSLRSEYTGQSAGAFFHLTDSWLVDANRIIQEFETFSSRLTSVDNRAATSEEESSATYRSQETPISARMA